jgi:hypothetical protein
VLSARLIERAREARRHPGHLDGQAAAAGPRTAGYALLPIEPTFVYDTSRDPGGLPDLGL